ncbi:MAG: Asparagine synthetase [glutamine-hydrolyzing] 3 [Candidatus Accumulibacter sp. BA-94]|nr:MAG: Asparagine synthetase [glutamine-hydrolyzing] 3 [Candidatus Accumulibacter sp. BA-94]
MCGIHGIYRFDGLSVEPGILSAMGERTRHRGPDDEGSHLDGPCGIAMRRLSIIDLAGGHQPLSNADGSLWLVCNGEIYNYRELRRELQDKGYHFKTGSDCEVLIHLYDDEGDAFIQRLNGMFDFALWDARRHRLLIGRDRLGVKPLYVLHDWQRLAFASEAKALLALPGISAELDRGVLADYLHLGYVAAPGCIFKGIRKLPPATLLAVEAGQVREWRYWRLPDRCAPGVSESEWCDRVRLQLDESVRMQMVSDVPIGAFLSGGVDSSAVVGLMARHSEQPAIPSSRSGPTPSVLPAARPRHCTTSSPMPAGWPNSLPPSTARSLSARMWFRCCRSSCGTWTNHCPIPPSSPPSSSPSSRARMSR